MKNNFSSPERRDSVDVASRHPSDVSGAATPAIHDSCLPYDRSETRVRPLQSSPKLSMFFEKSSKELQELF